VTEQARWIVASDEEVVIGDHVALARHPDSVGRIVRVAAHTGIPEVELIEGPNRGRTMAVWPSDILLKVQRYRR
jgi:hypothetical protein